MCGKFFVVEVGTRRPLEEHKLAVHLTCREQARPHTGNAGPEGGATKPVVCHGVVVVAYTHPWSWAASITVVVSHKY